MSDLILPVSDKVTDVEEGTKYLGLTYRRASPTAPGIQIFTDASHASDIDTRRSVSGIVVKHAGNTVFWKVCFQSIVSHSSSESELMALDKGATIGQYIKWLTVSMGVKHTPPIKIFVDNAASIDMTRSPVQQGGTCTFTPGSSTSETLSGTGSMRSVICERIGS